jgi:hypothetical protein
MREYLGHKLNISPGDGMARCQCNAWQWACGPDLGDAYAGHIRQEQKREAELIASISSTPAGPSRLAKVGQIAVLYIAFMGIMFTVLHFIG